MQYHNHWDSYMIRTWNDSISCFAIYMIKMASEREVQGKKTTRNASEADPINDLNVPTSDSNAKECVINDDVSEEKDLVRCFCRNDQDFGKMACCDLCS